MLLLLLAGGAQAAETPRVVKPAVLRGRAFVQQHCVGCHNAGLHGRSIYAAAPPLRDMGGRYTPTELRVVMADVQRGDHFAMPATVVSQRNALDIHAYLQALSKADSKIRRQLAIPPCVGGLC